MKLPVMQATKEEKEYSCSSTLPPPPYTKTTATKTDTEIENEYTRKVRSNSNDNCLREINLKDEFNIIKRLSKGAYGKILLAKKDGEKMVLKATRSEHSTWEDFQKELQYNYFLSPHPNIVTSYNVSFLWNNYFVFVQEYAPYGDLSKYLKRGALIESQVKDVMCQLSRAIEFMHCGSGSSLVHGDITPENILIFKPDLSLIKLCDFGSSMPDGTLVVKKSRKFNLDEDCFLPPEICEIIPQEKYYIKKTSDVWQVGICLYMCLTGSYPWQIADITDSTYLQYMDWHKRKSIRMPETFKTFTPRFSRLLKRLLEPKESMRCGIREVYKYLKDAWLEKHCCFSKLLRKESIYQGGNKNQQQQNNKQFSSNTCPMPIRNNPQGRHSRAKSLRVEHVSNNGPLSIPPIRRSTSYEITLDDKSSSETI